MRSKRIIRVYLIDPWVGGHLAPFSIHQMNPANFGNCCAMTTEPQTRSLLSPSSSLLLRSRGLTDRNRRSATLPSCTHHDGVHGNALAGSASDTFLAGQQRPSLRRTYGRYVGTPYTKHSAGNFAHISMLCRSSRPTLTLNSSLNIVRNRDITRYHTCSRRSSFDPYKGPA